MPKKRVLTIEERLRLLEEAHEQMKQKMDETDGPWGTPMTVLSRTQLKPVRYLLARWERRGDKIAMRRKLGLRRVATDTMPAKKRCGGSIPSTPRISSLPSQGHSTTLPSPKRYDNRYEDRFLSRGEQTPKIRPLRRKRCMLVSVKLDA